MDIKKQHSVKPGFTSIQINEKGGKVMGKVTINQNECKGCGLCVIACPKKILVLSKTSLNKKGYHPVEMTDEAACTACAACARMCPDVVLEVEK